jgi:hypothetical protein
MRWAMNATVAVLALAVASGLAACAKDHTADALCKKMVACGAMSAEACHASYDAMVLTDECLDGLLAGGDEACATLSDQDLRDLCFPPCTGSSYLCVPGDKIIICEGGSQATFSCDWLCDQQDMSYSDTCGMTGPDGSSEDHDVCWCWENT